MAGFTNAASRNSNANNPNRPANGNNINVSKRKMDNCFIQGYRRNCTAVQMYHKTGSMKKAAIF